MTSPALPYGKSSAEALGGLPILAFKSASALDAWLAMASSTSPGIWLQLAKKGAPIVSLSKPEAIDAALCHGWIDGQQAPYDAAHWLVRFTPRRRASRWSQINRARALELIADGRMHQAGLAEIMAARADGRWEAAYAPASNAAVPPELQAALDRSPTAAAAFDTTRRAVRYAMIHRLDAAKRLKTRKRLVTEFVDALERDAPIGSEKRLSRPTIAPGTS